MGSTHTNMVPISASFHGGNALTVFSYCLEFFYHLFLMQIHFTRERQAEIWGCHILYSSHPPICLMSHPKCTHVYTHMHTSKHSAGKDPNPVRYGKPKSSETPGLEWKRYFVLCRIITQTGMNRNDSVIKHTVYSIFCKDFIFSSSFNFRAVLSCRHRYILYCPSPHTRTASPMTNIPHRRGTFVTVDEPTLTHQHHPNFIV